MKLLYIHNKSIHSEMANAVQVQAMCSAISELEIDVTLSVPDYKKKGKVYTLNKDSGYKLHYRKTFLSSHKFGKYFSWRAIGKTIQRFKPDMLYLRHPMVLRQSLRYKIPTILELHNDTFYQRSKFIDDYYSKLIINHSKKNVLHKVVCISQALSNYWIDKGVPEDKIVTAHDAVDKELFDINLNRVEIRRQLNLPEEKKIISYAGRLYENRSIESVIQLAKTFPETLFLIIGGPETQKNKYEAIARSLNLSNVMFTGQIPHQEVPSFLQASDVLLALWSTKVPTINYCSPLKVFEYMAAGKIIVAHGFPVIKEVLTHNHNAILAKPDSVKDLIIKTGKALELGYPSKIAERARNEVFEKYTWKQRARKILKNVK